MIVFIEEWIEQNSKEIVDLSREIYNYAELAHEETKSMQALERYLAKYGFAIEDNCGLDTAFKAVWGSGKPIIGFLGEYDALPGLAQKPIPQYDCDINKPGHGCGHNLLGAGSAAAAVALKSYLEKTEQQGTVVYYGCPAEEVMEGKIIMAEHGCFQELDCALAWHPNIRNRAGGASNQAIDMVKFDFFGKTAHAATAPYLGRSALDAAELMNVGVNYLREHVTKDVSMHYSYLAAGDKPNIVPAYASVWYFIRAANRDNCTDATNRIVDIARGAALMTGTKMKCNFSARGYNGLPNFTIGHLAEENFDKIGTHIFSDEDKKFAADLALSLGNSPETSILDESVTPISKTNEVIFAEGSTDVSDVSQITPTINLHVTCAPKNTPSHHWAFAACAGSSIGQKGMLLAAKVLAQTGADLIENESLLMQAKEEFQTNAPGWVALEREISDPDTH